MKLLPTIAELKAKQDGLIERETSEVARLLSNPIDITNNIIQKAIDKTESRYEINPFSLVDYFNNKYGENLKKISQPDCCPVLKSYFFDTLDEFKLEVRVCPTSDNILIYNGKYWSDHLQKDFLNVAMQFYNRLNLQSNLFFQRESTKREYRNTIKISILQMKYKYDKPYKSVINFLNGTFELGISEKKSKFRKHNKLDGLTWILPYNYDPEATCPLWNKHLQTVLEGRKECIQGLNEFCGSIFYNPSIGKLTLEKCLVLLGEGRNGKSVVIEVIKAVVGAFNVAKARLEDLAGTERPQVIASINGKRVVMSAENTPGPSDFDKIRDIISQEDQRARHLYQSAFTATEIPLMIMAVNELMNFGKLDANWERLYPIMFEYSFVDNPNKILRYQDIIIRDDLPGIANLWIKSFWNLYKRQKLQESPRTIKLKQEWESETDSFVRWMEYEKLKPATHGEKVVTTHLHYCYLGFVEHILNKPRNYALGDVQFGKRLVKNKFVKTTYKGKYAYIVSKLPKDYKSLHKDGILDRNA